MAIEVKSQDAARVPGTQRIEAKPLVGRSLWSDAVGRLRRDWTAKLCLAVIALYALVAIGGVFYEALAAHDVVPTLDEYAQGLNARGVPVDRPPAPTNAAPNLRAHWTQWLGTDWNGKSALLKTLLGAKVSMSVGLIANLIAVPIGLLLGAIAGYFGRWRDSVIVWLFSTLASIPGIILLIAIKYAFQGVRWGPLDFSGIHGLYVALGVISWIGTCRLVRAETLKLRELDYVMAARASGRKSMSILLRHILPNVLHIAIISFSLGFVGAVQSEVILSYLGLGVPVGQPSWGSMINAARMDLVAGRWWEFTAAVTAMFFLVLALNIFGDRLRDALDPRLRNV